MLKNYNNIKNRNLDANKNDALYSRLFSHPFSILLVSLVEKTNITPNILTFISLLLTIVGTIYVSFVNTYFGLLIGFFFYHFSLVFDSADGQLARWKNLSSTFGAYFDGIVDHIKHRAIVIAIVYREMNVNENALLIGIIVVAIHSLAYYENQSRIIREVKDAKILNKKNEATNSILGTSKLKKFLAYLQIDLHEYFPFLAIAFIINKPMYLVYFIGVNSSLLLLKRIIIFYFTSKKYDNENSNP